MTKHRQRDLPLGPGYLGDPALARDLWLADRIALHAGTAAGLAFEGLCTPEIRRERLRAAILANALSTVILGEWHGKHETYGDWWKRIHGEEL